MAPVKGHISYQLIDGNKVPYALQVFFNCSTGLLTDIEIFNNAFIPLLDAVTNDAIEKSVFVINAILPGGIKTDPTAETNGGIGALLNYKDSSVPADHFSYWISGWIAAGFEADHPALVNQTDGGPVEAFLSGMLATVGNTNIVTEDDVNLAELRRATKSERTKRRALGLLR